MSKKTFIIQTVETREYVRIPVNIVKSTIVFIGPNKTWEVNAGDLTKSLGNKRKSPITFSNEGEFWTFYFDDQNGALYNSIKDEAPFLELRPAPKQKYQAPQIKPSPKKDIQEEKKIEPQLRFNVTPGIPEKRHKQDSCKTNKIPEKQEKAKNKQKAITILQSPPASSSYKSGKGHEAKGELEDAIKYYRAAFESGFTPAGYNLAKLFMTLAVDLFTQVAKQGHIGAQRELDKLTTPVVSAIPDGVLQHIWLHDTEEDEQFSVSRINRQMHKTGVGYPAGTSYHAQDFSAYEMVVKNEAQEQKNDKEEAKCTETESSGHELVDGEQHYIDLLEPLSVPMTGCFFCRLLQQLKQLFTH